jgi:hypothetical protein
VHRLFDPAYATRPQTPPQHMPEPIRALVEKPVAVSLTSASARSILNAIVRQHGPDVVGGGLRRRGGSLLGLEPVIRRIRQLEGLGNSSPLLTDARKASRSL